MYVKKLRVVRAHLYVTHELSRSQSGQDIRHDVNYNNRYSIEMKMLI